MATTSHREERYASDNYWHGSLGFFFVNRFQIVYYILFLPQVLVYPHMVWLIVIVAILSHFNLWMLSRWLGTEEARLGHAGFVRLFGTAAVRLLALLGIGVILLQSTVITLGYVRVVHQVLFSSMNELTLVFFLGVASFYLASLGIIPTGRFAILAFVGSVWTVFLYFQFLFPPDAEYMHLLPLFPDGMPEAWPAKFLTVWAAFAGPEYLAFAGKYFSRAGGLFRPLALGNAVTASEYILFLIITTMFFGSEFLRMIDLPVVEIIRYIELPFFERLEMIIIPVHMLPFVFVNALFIHYLHDAARAVMNIAHKPKSTFGLFLAALLLVIFMYVFGKHFWVTETDEKWWSNVYLWVSSTTYAVIPSFLALAAHFRKKRKEGGSAA